MAKTTEVDQGGTSVWDFLNLNLWARPHTDLIHVQRFNSKGR